MIHFDLKNSFCIYNMQSIPEHLCNNIISIIPRDRDMRSPTAALVREFISIYDSEREHTTLSFVEFFKYRDSILNYTEDENDNGDNDDDDSDSDSDEYN